jgi:hypothetical protein
LEHPILDTPGGHRRGPFAWLTLLATVGAFSLLLVTAFAIFAIAAALRQVKTDGPYDHCSINLKMLCLGLAEYADQYGSLPPAFVADDEGKPMHSWRVLILPFIEQQPLYDQYDFSEPWNGPHNLRLATAAPAVFRCPDDQPLGGPRNDRSTSYVAVVGPRELWRGTDPIGFDPHADDNDNTIMLVEVFNSGIDWLEPCDLSLADLSTPVNSKAPLGLSSRHRDGVHVLYANGRTQFLPPSTTAAQLRAAFAHEPRD